MLISAKVSRYMEYMHRILNTEFTSNFKVIFFQRLPTYLKDLDGRLYHIIRFFPKYLA